MGIARYGRLFLFVVVVSAVFSKKHVQYITLTSLAVCVYVAREDESDPLVRGNPQKRGGFFPGRIFFWGRSGFLGSRAKSFYESMEKL